MLLRYRPFSITFFLILSSFLVSGLIGYQMALTTPSVLNPLVGVLPVLAVAIALTLLFSYWLSQRFFRPLHLISLCLDRIKNSDYTHKLPPLGDQDFKNVFENVNTLLDEVSKARSAKDLIEKSVNSIHDAIFIIEIYPDQEPKKQFYRIRNVNLAAADLLGLSVMSLIGSDLKMWLEIDYEKTINTNLQSIEGILKKNSGERVPLELSWSRIRCDEFPHPILVVVGRDIREKKEIEKRLQFKEELLKESQSLSKMGSFRWELSTGSTLCTEEILHILGIQSSAPNLNFDLFCSLILPEDRPLFEKALEESRRPFQYLNFDLRMRKMNTQEIIWIRCHGRTEYDSLGNPIFIYGTVQDITDLRKNEQALIATKDMALKSSQAKSEFLAKMSHEIRTPMNAIMGMTELLKETKLSEDQQYYISIFHRAGESLMALINDILDLSKIEAGEVSIENVPYDLKILVSEVEEIMKPRALKKDLACSFEISPNVETALIGDPFKLRQVLLNLVNNAIKFTASGSVQVLVEKNLTKKDTLLFNIIDTGVGIPKEQQQLIFQKFSQADSSISRRFGGTGLGLAISKSIVELMGGQIWLKSQEGVGTIFHFTTPYREQVQKKKQQLVAPAKVADRPTTSRSGQKMDRAIQVLIVDDTQDNRVLFTHFLKLQPVEIIEAQNGLEALDKIKSRKFDIIFMDVQMPEIDGYAVTDMIRKWEKEQHQSPTPIIALTAHALSEDRQRSLNAGCDDHVAKPFKRETLVNVINQYTI